MYLSVVECLPFCPYIVKRQSVRPLSVWHPVVERQVIRSCPSQPFTAINAQNLPEFNCHQFNKLCLQYFDNIFSRMQTRDSQKHIYTPVYLLVCSFIRPSVVLFCVNTCLCLILQQTLTLCVHAC